MAITRTRRPTGGTPTPVSKPSIISTSTKKKDTVNRTRRPTGGPAVPRNFSGIVTNTGKAIGEITTPTTTTPVNSQGRVMKPASGGYMPPETTPTPTVTPPVETPTPVAEPIPTEQEIMPTKVEEPTALETGGATVGLREIAEGQGLKVGYDEATKGVTIGGVPVDVSQLEIQDGRYVGGDQQINNLVNLAKLGVTRAGIPEGVQGLREYLSSQGLEVTYDAESKQVFANGIPVDVGNMGLLDGRYYGRQDELQAIANSIKQQQQGEAVQDMQMQGEELTGEKQLQQAEQGLVDVIEENAVMKETGLDTYLEGIQKLNSDLIEFKTNMMNEFNAYKPVYREEALNIIRNAYGNPFQYDPERDPALTQAMKTAERQIMNAMNSRGLLNSTITRDNMAQALGNMIPQYEQIAYSRYMEDKQQQLKFADKLMQIDEQDYNKFKDYVSFSMETMQSITSDNIKMAKETLSVYNEKLKVREEAAIQEVKNKEAQLKRANDLWEKYGFVTNEISSILGLPVNTPTADVYKKILTEQGLNDRKLADIEEKRIAREENFQNTIAEIDYKNAVAQENDLIEAEKARIAGTILSELSKYPLNEAISLFNQNYPVWTSQYPEATQQIDAIRDWFAEQKQQQDLVNYRNQQISLSERRLAEDKAKREQDKNLFTTSQMITSLKDIRDEFVVKTPEGEIDASKASLDNPKYLKSVLTRVDGFNVDKETENQLVKSILGITLPEAQAINLINEGDFEEQYKQISKQNINPYTKQTQLDNLTKQIYDNADRLGDNETANIIKKYVDNPNYSKTGEDPGLRQAYFTEQPLSKEQYDKLESFKKKSLLDIKAGSSTPKSVFEDIAGGD